MKEGTKSQEALPLGGARRRKQRAVNRGKEEQNRQHALGGGTPNELGVTQGQNGEQGNTVEPRNAKPLGRLAH